MTDLPDPMHLTQLLIEWMEAARGELIPNDEHPRSDEDEDETAPVGGIESDEDEPPGIHVVGAWAGTASLAKPAEYVRFAAGLGLGRLDIIVNDHAKAREPRSFDTYSIDHIERLAAVAIKADIEVHFMSWLMPHAEYIEGAARILVPLVQRTGARSVCFDCEEPWTQARHAMPYRSAAAHLAELIDNDIDFGVTGIGYAPVQKLAPICAVANYLVPQCYATKSSKLDPATVVARFASRWRRCFPGKRIVAGLAAYRQRGVPGYSVEAALRAAFGGARSDHAIHEVVYWSLAQIKDDATVAKTIAALTRGS